MWFHFLFDFLNIYQTCHHTVIITMVQVNVVDIMATTVDRSISKKPQAVAVPVSCLEQLILIVELNQLTMKKCFITCLLYLFIFLIFFSLQKILCLLISNQFKFEISYYFTSVEAPVKGQIRIQGFVPRMKGNL